MKLSFCINKIKEAKEEPVKIGWCKIDGTYNEDLFLSCDPRNASTRKKLGLDENEEGFEPKIFYQDAFVKAKGRQAKMMNRTINVFQLRPNNPRFITILVDLLVYLDDEIIEH